MENKCHCVKYLHIPRYLGNSINKIFFCIATFIRKCVYNAVKQVMISGTEISTQTSAPPWKKRSWGSPT